MSAQDLSEQTPVTELPYYNSLREILEPYQAAQDVGDATEFYSTPEIISQIEMHHGVPQGPQQGLAVNWIKPDDFVRAMHYLGFREKNTGGMQLEWLLKKK